MTEAVTTTWSIRVVSKDTGYVRREGTTDATTIERARELAQQERPFWNASFSIQILRHTITVEETL